jgi:hypothetical protein
LLYQQDERTRAAAAAADDDDESVRDDVLPATNTVARDVPPL